MPKKPRKKLKYVREFTDRHGKVRRYFRRRGYEQVALPGDLDMESLEFLDAYRDARAGKTAQKQPIGEDRVVPGTINAVVVAYYKTTAFTNLRPHSQRNYRSYLEALRREHGDKRAAAIQRDHVEKMVEDMRDTPSACAHFRSALRVVMKQAIKMRLRKDDPTMGVELPKIKGDGYYTWNEADISAFRRFYKSGSTPRLALEGLLSTALRREDIVVLGPGHVRDGVIYITPQKTEDSTGIELAIPIHPAFARELRFVWHDGPTFLVGDQGEPFTPNWFTKWFKDKCSKVPGLPTQVSAHGLRKAACRRLAEAGCSLKQIAAISGHKDYGVLMKYIEKAEQAWMAEAAIEAVTLAFPLNAKRTKVANQGKRFAKYGR